VQGPLFNMSHCHCGMCRKAHAAPFATYVGATASGFQYDSGEQEIARYKSSSVNERCFCGRCGSVVPTGRGRKSVYFPAGCIDDAAIPEALSIRRSAHIFVGSKAAWYTIDDELPQHAEYPEAWQQASATVLRVNGAAPDGAARPDNSATGSCLCGRVAYAIAAGPALGLYYCHCSRCRKARAAAHNANIFIERSRFEWLRGESELGSFKVPDAERYSQVFCRHCGSGMPIARAERAVVPAGSVDTPFTPADLRHIFVSSKAPWFEIRDSITQWVEYPG
jgi:hypothetical protein